MMMSTSAHFFDDSGAPSTVQARSNGSAFRRFALIVLVLFTGACYNYRSIAAQPAGPEAVGGSRGAATDPQRDVVWARWWGLVQESPQIDNCNGQPLHEVTVRRNFLHALVTVISLGSFSPAVVEWTCAKPAGSGVIPDGNSRTHTLDVRLSGLES
ncbi:hypothetical protein [Candidatus Palauibacter sp.]|uniref:hypothetical protein n=1 Tax=Candidatus Palauibacter sp. TaxID=3101350 RepID=UPI003B020434